MKKVKLSRIIFLSVLLFIIGYIFYNSIWISLLFITPAPFFENKWSTYLKNKQQLQKLEQFQYALNSLSSFINLGKSLENALLLTTNELHQLYPNHQTFILEHFHKMIHLLANGETVERVFYDFSIQSKLPEIEQFSSLLLLTLRRGGDIKLLFNQTSSLIRDKFEVMNEIEILLAQKKFEAAILSMAPIIFLGFMRWSSPEFMIPLYQSSGRIIMSIGLFCFITSYYFIYKLLLPKF